VWHKALADLQGALGRPYFADNGFILYRGDCLELLKAIRGKVSVNLTLTSPPYNIGKEYERNLPLEEYLAWCGEWMTAVHGITASDGAFWLNLGYVPVEGRGKAIPLSYLLWNRSPFFLIQEIVWNYGAGVAAKTSFSPRNEKWLFYAMNEGKYAFHLDAVRDPDVKYPNQKKNGKLRCNPLGKNPTDVWAIPKVTSGTNRSSKERTTHPAQFPLAVVDRIVKVSSAEDEIVLDPFSGSGSAGIGAVGNGRIYIGFEIRRDYCDLSVERFRAYLKARSETPRQATLAL
jgi:adenine-specific DNA-methyltransferase